MGLPQSIINVCTSVRLNNRYEHTIYFTSRTAQLSYFASKVVRTFSAYTYLRKSWSIKVQATMESARDWNYLYFTNDGAKYWYYFITNIEYINDGTVELFLELDVMQTYATDYTFLPCFVERQHVENDTAGLHLVDENLDGGEYVTISEEHIDLNDMCIMMLTTFDPVATSTDETVNISGGLIDKCFSGLMLTATSTAKSEELATKIVDDFSGVSDGIISMWMFPAELLQFDTDTGALDVGTMFNTVKGSLEYISKTFTKPTVLDNSYKPRNNKLLSYPYSMLYVTNNLGEAATYRYEYFPTYNDRKLYFRMIGTCLPPANVKLYPVNYLGEDNAFEHGISLANFPTCSWSQDMYKLWLAQNEGQHTLSIVGGAVAIGAGIAATATGAGAIAGIPMIAGGVNQLTGLLAQAHDRNVQPSQAKGTASSSLNLAHGWQTFTVKKKSIREEYAKILDGFFDMYGYRLNEVRTPNPNARAKWTYIKTNGCKINCDFCAEDAAKIESIIDKGITFWKNGNLIADYGDAANNTPNG